VIGTNPGEPENTYDKYGTEPTEETHLYDFHAELRGERREDHHWSKRAIKFLNTKPVVFTEFFFWSSLNAGEAFQDRFGSL
jgi:hypothetical protein